VAGACGAWIDSLRAVAEADGPRVICYNFMPVLDWTRTDLRHPVEGGGTAMRFDLTDFAAFDLHLLLRDGRRRIIPMTCARRPASAPPHSTPSRPRRWPQHHRGPAGATESWTLDDVRACLADYAGMGPDDLRRNLIGFLKEVVPVAEELGLRLCCHPDDPPFPLLGLPRVMSTLADYETVLEAVPSPANGATFCTGSLGVRADFDPVAFVRRIGPRIHFAHLRNTTRDADGDGLRVSFEESAHLAGDTDMVATIGALWRKRRRDATPGASTPKSRCGRITAMTCWMT
jgi:mannonate dehydratase